MRLCLLNVCACLSLLASDVKFPPRSMSTPNILSSSQPRGVYTPPTSVCEGPVCAKFGHSSIAHETFAAVAMWCFNECEHCKSAVSAKRSPSSSVTSDSPSASDADDKQPSIQAVGAPVSPSFAAAAASTDTDIPSVTLGDEEVISLLQTDGYGMLMDEQVSTDVSLLLVFSFSPCYHWFVVLARDCLLSVPYSMRMLASELT